MEGFLIEKSEESATSFALPPCVVVMFATTKPEAVLQVFRLTLGQAGDKLGNTGMLPQLVGRINRK